MHVFNVFFPVCISKRMILSHIIKQVGCCLLCMIFTNEISLYNFYKWCTWFNIFAEQVTFDGTLQSHHFHDCFSFFKSFTLLFKLWNLKQHKKLRSFIFLTWFGFSSLITLFRIFHRELFETLVFGVSLKSFRIEHFVIEINWKISRKSATRLHEMVLNGFSSFHSVYLRNAASIIGFSLKHRNIANFVVFFKSACFYLDNTQHCLITLQTYAMVKNSRLPWVIHPSIDGIF